MNTKSDVPPIPKAKIFLRDRFAVVPGMENQFFRNKTNLLERTKGKWSLIAAAGETPFLQDKAVTAPASKMMHVWRFEEWDTLYESMYAFTDTSWYAALQEALLYEDQDLLVGISTYPTTPRAAWKSDTEPGRVYLYEEILLRKETTAHAFLRDAFWFASEVSDSWSLTWSGLQVTGRPSLICSLWSVPSVEAATSTLELMANDPAHAKRYAKLLSQVQSISREYLHPSSVERIADKL